MSSKNYGSLGIQTFWLDARRSRSLQRMILKTTGTIAGPVAEVGNIYPREYARLFYEGTKAGWDRRRLVQSDPLCMGRKPALRCAWCGRGDIHVDV